MEWLGVLVLPSALLLEVSRDMTHSSMIRLGIDLRLTRCASSTKGAEVEDGPRENTTFFSCLPIRPATFLRNPNPPLPILLTPCALHHPPYSIPDQPRLHFAQTDHFGNRSQSVWFLSSGISFLLQPLLERKSDPISLFELSPHVAPIRSIPLPAPPPPPVRRKFQICAIFVWVLRR